MRFRLYCLGATTAVLSLLKLLFLLSVLSFSIQVQLLDLIVMNSVVEDMYTLVINPQNRYSTAHHHALIYF